MSKKFKQLVMVFVATVVCLSATPAHAAALPLYRIKDLGAAPGYATSQANGLSSNGLVAGLVQNNSDYPYAATFQNNTINTYNSNPSVGLDINASSLATGFALNTENKMEAAIFQNSSTSFLGVLPGEEHSTGVAINDDGVIVGISGHGIATGDPIEYAVLFQNNSLTNLGVLPGHNSSWGIGINNNDVASGTSFDLGSQVYNISRAVIFKNGTVIPLGDGSGCDSFGRKLNDSEQVAGVVELCDQTQKPAIFSGEQTIYLPLPSGNTQGVADAINNLGIVVGGSMGPDNQVHATLYTTSAAYKLSDLVNNVSDWTLESATDINDRGQITGTGYHNGELRAYLLTPTSLNRLLSLLSLPPTIP